VHSDLITKWVGRTSLKMTSKYKHFSAKHRKDVISKLGSIASQGLCWTHLDHLDPTLNVASR
jgi:hypothetical protein